MSEFTKIEWCDHTFNPWIGCTKVGPGCDNCYAKADFDDRKHRVTWGAGQPRSRTKTWRDPVRWNKQHAAFFAEHGRKQRVFCASLADIFDNEVPVSWRMDLFSLIADTPNLDWLILTKRIGNVISMSSFDGLMFDMIGQRVWLGATICNQAEADRDIPKLAAMPAHNRFLSMEPLLGPVDLGFDIPWQSPPIDLVIVGGESGPNARPMHPDWARSLRDQCEAAGVPFLFKQWGEWCPETVHCTREAAKTALYITPDGATRPAAYGARRGATTIQRVGKKSAGRLLDGREWNGVPA